MIIPQGTVDHLMSFLGPRGWTEEQVYDDIKHNVLNVPRIDDSSVDAVCQTCYVTTSQDWTPAEGQQ